MTDETTTRIRRRIRVRSQSDQSSSEARTRTRARGSDQTTPPPPEADETTSSQVRRRRVRKRATDRATAGGDGVQPEVVGQPDVVVAPEPAVTSESTGADSDSARDSGAADRGRRPQNGPESKANGRSKNGGGQKKSPDNGDAEEPATASAADENESRSRKQRNRKNRRKQGGAPRGGVSEETRRAITEGPPRRMLVSVRPERTEVAVLEERDLVEHYVTRKENESYVGNIYLGRVQNVLPGMEAAFVDIGKGRNGVLYAGEVNYDDEDIESKAPRIEQVLKPGQTVLVQVTKDPMGTKGARLTQQLSLAGRYCVLAIEDGTVGISRKLTDTERDRLRETLKEIKPEGYGLIVRTAASGATREQLEADVKRLVHRWEQVQERLEKAKPLTEVYREPELAMRVIRDVFGPEYRELICDDHQLTEQIQEYLSEVSPDLLPMVTFYESEEPLFDAYEITNQVRRALEKKVWLSSGGYLIIEKTEAMWVIDVNTGKFVGDSNLEETVLKNNLEAAEEIARQLRLRDMGGIIVIDFVDMLLPVNRDEVLKRFKRELARDKTKSRVMEISKLGLVQMTRKNVSQGLTETFTKTCECCEGRGAQIVDKSLQR
jgi:Rne/Rng family ribonuclease